MASPWMAKVKVDNHKVVLKIYTGANVTAVPVKSYIQDQFDKLSKATWALYRLVGTPLKVKGKFTATLSKENKSTQEEVNVMNGLHTPLLRGLAAMTLQLAARLNDVSLDAKETIKREFPKLFSGLGKMKGEYFIVL